jgi:hypothetical protein
MSSIFHITILAYGIVAQSARTSNTKSHECLNTVWRAADDYNRFILIHTTKKLSHAI